MEAKEQELIASALRSTDGNVAAAAKLLGLPRSTLRSKLGKRRI
jgi:DNA-binding protein Fis